MKKLIKRNKKKKLKSRKKRIINEAEDPLANIQGPGESGEPMATELKNERIIQAANKVLDDPAEGLKDLSQAMKTESGEVNEALEEEVSKKPEAAQGQVEAPNITYGVLSEFLGHAGQGIKEYAMSGEALGDLKASGEYIAGKIEQGFNYMVKQAQDPKTFEGNYWKYRHAVALKEREQDESKLWYSIKLVFRNVNNLIMKFFKWIIPDSVKKAVKTMWRKMKEFFEKVWNWIRGYGYKLTSTIAKDIGKEELDKFMGKQPYSSTLAERDKLKEGEFTETDCIMEQEQVDAVLKKSQVVAKKLVFCLIGFATSMLILMFLTRQEAGYVSANMVNYVAHRMNFILETEAEREKIRKRAEMAPEQYGQDQWDKTARRAGSAQDLRSAGVDPNVVYTHPMDRKPDPQADFEKAYDYGIDSESDVKRKNEYRRKLRVMRAKMAAGEQLSSDEANLLKKMGHQVQDVRSGRSLSEPEASEYYRNTQKGASIYHNVKKYRHPRTREEAMAEMRESKKYVKRPGVKMIMEQGILENSLVGLFNILFFPFRAMFGSIEGAFKRAIEMRSASAILFGSIAVGFFVFTLRYMYRLLNILTSKKG